MNLVCRLILGYLFIGGRRAFELMMKAINIITF